MRGADLWLSVKGAGVVHSRADLAEHSALSLAGQALLTPQTLAEPDMADVIPLLTHYYGDAPAPALRRIPRYARFGLLAALRALNSAGWTKDMLGQTLAETLGQTLAETLGQTLADATPSESPQAALLSSQTMLALGTAHSGVSMSMDFMDSLLDQGPRLSSPTAFSHAVNNMGAGLLSLLLGVRGSCQTLSQFSLSFAGALHAAALALHSGRARRALVGAVDETDPRFDLNTFAPSTAHALNTRGMGKDALPPATQGAVFLCVEALRVEEVREDKFALGQTLDQTQGQTLGQTLGQTRGLCVRWGETAPASQPALTLLSGDAQPADMTDAGQDHLRLAPHYGITPLAQALDVFLALRQDIPTVRCVCAHAPFGRQATVEVRRFA